MSKATHYTELGLANTKNMFKKAMAEGYAIPAYNFNNMEQLQGIIIGCVESRSPVIVQVSGSARKYANQTFLPYMAMGAVQMASELGASIFRSPCIWTTVIPLSLPNPVLIQDFLP